MPMLKRLTLLLAKIEASRGMATGGSATTIVDANQGDGANNAWVADDGVKVGDKVIINTFAAGSDGEFSYITDITADTLTVFPAFTAAIADGDIYEIIVEGGLAGNEQDFAISGTGDVGSDTTNLVDAALNALDGFAHLGIEAGNQVYITGGGGIGGSAVISAVDHANDKFTFSPAITGVTTDSTFEVRPMPVLLFEVEHNFDITMFERKPLRTSLTALAQIPGERMSTITAQLELAGGTSYANFAAGTPAAGSLPAYTSLIRACGVGVTVVGSTSVSFKPISRGIPAVTIGTYEDGILKKSLGCRGTFGNPNEKGAPGLLNLTLSGVPLETASSLITDTAFPEGIIYPGIVPPTVQGITVGAYAYIIQALSFDMGNTVIMRNSVAAVAGNLAAIITDRAIVGTFNPEMLKKADHDFWAKLIAGTLVELNAQLGATAGNVIKIGSPAGQTTAQYIGFTDADREGIKTLDASFAMVSVTDEGEFEIKIT